MGKELKSTHRAIEACKYIYLLKAEEAVYVIFF